MRFVYCAPISCRIWSATVKSGVMVAPRIAVRGSNLRYIAISEYNPSIWTARRLKFNIGKISGSIDKNFTKSGATRVISHISRVCAYAYILYVYICILYIIYIICVLYAFLYVYAPTIIIRKTHSKSNEFYKDFLNIFYAYIIINIYARNNAYICVRNCI